MTRRIRNLISTVFALVFFISAPLVLLSTAGYKYDWKKGKVEKSGIVQTDSIPTGATVFINGVNQKAKTPADLARLLPEDYTVRFELGGYFPWQKNVEVRSGSTTFVTGAALITDELPELKYAAEILAISFSRDGRRSAFIKSTAEWRELHISGSDGFGADLLARLAKIPDAGDRIEWSSRGDQLLHAAKNADGSLAVVTYDAEKGRASQSIQSLIGRSRIQNAVWTTDGSLVMVQTAGGYSAVESGSGKVTLVAAGNSAQDADVQGRDTYILRTVKDGVELLKGTLGASEPARLLKKLPPGKYGFIRESGPYLLVVDYGKIRLLAISPDDGFIQYEVPGNNARWYTRARESRLLAWSDYEITVADIRTKEHRLITRLGTPIRSCEWHPSGLAVFYSSANALRAADVDAHEPRNVFDLAVFDRMDAFSVNYSDDVLYFSGSTGNQHGIFARGY